MDELHDTRRWTQRWKGSTDDLSLYYPLAFYRSEPWTSGDELMRVLHRYATGTALEVGCGTGKNSYLMASGKGVRPVLFDLTRESLELARDMCAQGNVAAACVRGDACHLPFPDAAFDTVVSDCTLEHIPDYRRAFAECSRVCRSGGHMIVTVPNILRLDGWPFAVLWSRARGHDFGLARNFQPAELRSLFRDIGLEPVEAFSYGVFYSGAVRIAADKVTALANLLRVPLNRTEVTKWFLRDKRRAVPWNLGIEIGLVGRKR